MPLFRNQSFSLAGEVAIVTGASSGIGEATARTLARHGASVVLAARRTELIAGTAAEIRSFGGTAVALRTDVSSDSDVAQLVSQTVDRFGHIDVLVNNAGVFWSRRFATSPQLDIAGLVDVNLVGAMRLAREVLPRMMARRHGAIISVGSLSGRVAMEPVYSASKYGLRGFSLALRRQLMGSGVSVSLVSPGQIATAMTSHIEGQLPDPSIVATAIVSLIARPRRELIVPARHCVIALLEQVLPRLADVVYERRGWSPVNDEEAVAWRS